MPGGTLPPTSVGGAGVSVYDSIMKGQGSVSVNDNYGRYLSYRVVRCGIKIFAQDNITIKQGVLTMGSIPGKEGNSYAVTAMALPTVAQMR